MTMRENGGLPAGYVTEVSKVLKKYEAWGLSYLDKPNHDTDDASVFVGSNREDRAGIVSEVQKYIESWNNVNASNVKKQDIVIAQDKEEVVLQEISRIEDGFLTTTQDLRKIAFDYNLTNDQLDRLIDANNLATVVRDVSSQISTFEYNEQSGQYKLNAAMTTFDVNNLMFQRTNYLNGLGIEITQEELTDKAMMDQMFRIVSSVNPNITQSQFNDMDLSTVVASGAAQDNLITSQLVELSKTYGAVPSLLENYFSSMDSFNFEVQADRQELRNMAEFANNLSET